MFVEVPEPRLNAVHGRLAGYARRISLKSLRPRSRLGTSRQGRGKRRSHRPNQSKKLTLLALFELWGNPGDNRLLHAVSEAYDRDAVMIDSACVCVHQCAAADRKGDRNDDDMGRSRGGLTRQIHALIDVEGRPVTPS